MKRAVAAVVVALSVLAASACGGSAPASSHPSQATKVRLPFGLGALSADGTRVAAVPAGRNPQLGLVQNLPAVIWDASTGGVEKLKLPHICPNPSASALAGAEVVVLCDDSCCGGSDQRVAVLRTGNPAMSLMHVRTGGRHSARIDGLAGSGNLVVFNRDAVDGRGRATRGTLYRVDGTRAHPITTRKAVGQPVATAGGLILTRQTNGPAKPQNIFPDSVLRIFRANGDLVTTAVDLYSVPTYVPDPPLLLDGKNILGVDFFSHELSASRPDGSYVQRFCEVGPGATVGGISGGLVAYTTADAVHVIRTTDCRDAVLAVGGGLPVGAVMTDAGVFYAFNSAPTIGLTGAQLGHVRSTISFVPMSRVVAAVSRGLHLRARY
jgi:hypothetical protein